MLKFTETLFVKLLSRTPVIMIVIILMIMLMVFWFLVRVGKEEEYDDMMMEKSRNEINEKFLTNLIHYKYFTNLNPLQI